MNAEPIPSERHASRGAALRVPGCWPKQSWADQGDASAEAAFQTLLWALREHSSERANHVTSFAETGGHSAWENISAKDGAISKCDWIFVLARLGETPNRAILMGHLGNSLDEKLPVVACTLSREGEGWRLVRVRVF